MGMRAVVIALLGMAASAAVAPAFSAVLIQIDVTNPAAVTFTATGNFSQVNDSSTSVSAGVDLMQFFSSALPDAESFGLSGDLRAPNTNALSYDQAIADQYPSLLTSLNFYYGPYSDDPQEFSTASAAFAGAATVNMSAFASYLPGAGASGDIIVGYSFEGSHAVIGQWTATAVPEPSMLLLGAAGAVVFLGRRGTASR